MSKCSMRRRNDVFRAEVRSGWWKCGRTGYRTNLCTGFFYNNMLADADDGFEPIARHRRVYLLYDRSQFLRFRYQPGLS